MSDKALGRSISFRPEKIYRAAVSFGNNQKPEMNVSEVVCDALREYFSARGVDWEEAGEQSIQAAQRGAYLARMEELGLDVDGLLAAIIAEREQAALQPAEAAS